MLLIQWLHNPWLFLSSDNSEPLDNGNPWFNLSFSPFPFHFPSILQRLLYLASYSTLSSCVSFGSVSTPDFSVMWSWTPSRSQMCFLFMLKHLGLNAVLSRQRGKFAKKKKKFNCQLIGGLYHPDGPGRHCKGVGGETEARGMSGDGNPGEARSSHSPMLGF